MNRFTFFLVAVAVFIVLPLTGALHLISEPEILYVIFSVGILNFTQPGLGKEEAEVNKESDKNTVKMLVIATGLSISIPVIDYAYLRGASVETSWFIAGVVINLSGLFLRAWSIRILGKFFTATVQIKDDHQLIKSGPYRIIRHPSYTGAAIAISGISVVLNSWIGFLACVLLLGMAYYYRITAEEEELGRFFGESYQDYSRNTYRIIPYLW